MTNRSTQRPIVPDEDEALRLLAEGAASPGGASFFRALVHNLVRCVATAGAWVTECQPNSRRLRVLAYWLDGSFVEPFDYPLEGTPCALVIETSSLLHVPHDLAVRFPEDSHLGRMEAQAYLGAPLLSSSGVVLGHLATFDTRPIPDDSRILGRFRVLASQGAAELRRLRSEDDLHLRDLQLSAVLENVLDPILLLDGELAVLRANAAAATLLRQPAHELQGEPLQTFLQAGSASRILTLVRGLARASDPPTQPQVWFTRDLRGRRADDCAFAAEANLMRFELRGSASYCLVLRDLEQRSETQRRLDGLTHKVAQLQQIIADLRGPSPELSQDPGPPAAGSKP